MNKFTWFCLFVPARILLSTLDLLSFILFSKQDETRFALWLSEYAMVFLALAVGLKAPALAVPNYSRMENDAENPSTNVSSCILVMTACVMYHNGLMESRSQFLAWVWIVSSWGFSLWKLKWKKPYYWFLDRSDCKMADRWYIFVIYAYFSTELGQDDQWKTSTFRS